MARKERTFLEEAAHERKWAKGIRIYGMVLYVLAGAAGVAVIWMFASGNAGQGALTLVSTVVIGFWGWFARNFQAKQFEDIARSYEGMEVRYGYLYR